MSADWDALRKDWEICKNPTHLDHFSIREEARNIVSLNRWVDDDLVSLLPVDWSSDTVLVAELQGIDDSEDLSEVASSGGWVLDLQTDHPLWVDDKDGSDGEGNTLGIDVGGVQSIEHVVLSGDLSVLVSDDGELEDRLADLVDVLDPFVVGRNVVGGQA